MPGEVWFELENRPDLISIKISMLQNISIICLSSLFIFYNIVYYV